MTTKYATILYAEAWRDESEENRRAYDWFVKRAKSYAAQGHFFGMKDLAEEYRWHVWQTADKQGGFKLNNSIVTPLSRLILQDAPEVEPWMVTRKAKCDSEKSCA